MYEREINETGLGSGRSWTVLASVDSIVEVCYSHSPYSL